MTIGSDRLICVEIMAICFPEEVPLTVVTNQFWWWFALSHMPGTKIILYHRLPGNRWQTHQNWRDVLGCFNHLLKQLLESTWTLAGLRKLNVRGYTSIHCTSVHPSTHLSLRPCMIHANMLGFQHPCQNPLWFRLFAPRHLTCFALKCQRTMDAIVAISLPSTMEGCHQAQIDDPQDQRRTQLKRCPSPAGGFRVSPMIGVFEALCISLNESTGGVCLILKNSQLAVFWILLVCCHLQFHAVATTRLHSSHSMCRTVVMADPVMVRVRSSFSSATEALLRRAVNAPEKAWKWLTNS